MKGRKTGGRVKGTPNKQTQINNAIGYNLQRDGIVPLLQYLMFGGQVPKQLEMGNLLSIMNEVRQDKPVEFLFFFEKLMQYVIPKRQSSSVDLTASVNESPIKEELLKLSEEAESSTSTK